MDPGWVNRAWMGLNLNANRETDPLWSQKYNITGVNNTTLCNSPEVQHYRNVRLRRGRRLRAPDHQ